MSEYVEERNAIIAEIDTLKLEIEKGHKNPSVNGKKEIKKQPSPSIEELQLQ